MKDNASHIIAHSHQLFKRMKCSTVQQNTVLRFQRFWCQTFIQFSSRQLTPIRDFVVQVCHDTQADPHLLVRPSVVRAHLGPPACKYTPCHLCEKPQNSVKYIYFPGKKTGGVQQWKEITLEQVYHSSTTTAGKLVVRGR